MVKLLVIADDFTGALDTGVQFSVRGIPTLVTVGDEIDFQRIVNYTDTSADQKIQVVVVDLESRHISAADAAYKVANIVKQALHSGVEYFYKKTDSTLRGNIGAELSALLESGGTRSLAFVPAYPKTGRTTENGCQFVNGIPLHQTAFAKDPLNPIDDSYIPAIIKSQSDCTTVVTKLSRDSFVHNAEMTPGNHQNCVDEVPSIVVFDASTDDDLLQIGRLLKETDNLRITAGCAGFAAALPDLLELTAIEDAGSRKSLPIYNLTTIKSPETLHTKKTLILCGSLNEVSLEQVRYAESKGWPSIAVPVEIMLHDSKSENGLFRSEDSAMQDILSFVMQNETAVIKTIGNSDDLNFYIRYGEALGLDKKEIHLRIAHNIGLLVKHISTQMDIDSFVVFGGDTALGIMEAMKWDGLMPLDEILPGIAVSKVLKAQPSRKSGMQKSHHTDCLHKASEKQSKYLITKAGGFGDKDVLIHIEKYLTEKGEFTC